MFHRVPWAIAAMIGWSSTIALAQLPESRPPASILHRPITTRSADAQLAFDQGLLACFGFNHEEAIASFRHAAECDPAAAMPWWGQALAAGPNINNPDLDDAANQAATKALAEARERVGNASQVERDLIDALAKRYANPPPTDRRALDLAYASAMREVWKKHASDADVGALFAESLMDLRPWDLWTKDGKPQPETPEILATLEAVRTIAPAHPGALHYTIHSLEASGDPGRALPAADRLRDLAPEFGHLVHMPSHIDIRVGHYEAAIRANQRGIDADLRYVARVGRGHRYDVYRAHNYHFLAYAAMFDGQSKVAIEAARTLVKEVPREMVLAMPQFLEAFLTMPYAPLVRFGRWEEILAEPEPAAALKSAVAMWHHARGMAFSATGRVDEAARELAAFEKQLATLPATYLFGNNPSKVVLAIGVPLLQGELEYRRGHFDRAFELLRDAVKQDDQLRYDEPWGWMQPVRHALGALLVEQGQIAEAREVYDIDLERHPENGWALHGLAECLHRSEREMEAADVEARFAKAWARADVKLRGSCFCRTK